MEDARPQRAFGVPGDGRSLLVCCSAFHGKKDAFKNLTLKKIPAAVSQRCEWGRDDYSLAVAALPEPEESKSDPPAKGSGRAAPKAALAAARR